LPQFPVIGDLPSPNPPLSPVDKSQTSPALPDLVLAGNALFRTLVTGRNPPLFQQFFPFSVLSVAVSIFFTFLSPPLVAIQNKIFYKRDVRRGIFFSFFSPSDTLFPPFRRAAGCLNTSYFPLHVGLLFHFEPSLRSPPPTSLPSSRNPFRPLCLKVPPFPV